MGSLTLFLVCPFGVMIFNRRESRELATMSDVTVRCFSFFQERHLTLSTCRQIQDMLSKVWTSC